MTNHFYVGQQVVCVDDKVPLDNGAVVKDANITEGHVYTIRWLGMSHLYVIGDYLGVKLEGVDSKFGEAWGQPDAPYNARRFKPLVYDRLASLRNIAADPRGYVPDSIDEPTRAPAREDERERVEEDEREKV